jgi:hypothetical protein
MRTRFLGWGLALSALFTAGIYRVASAQAQTTAPSAPARETSMGLQREASLSPQEEVKQADSFVGRIAVTGSSVRRMLEQARAQRDVVKTLCLNDKVNQIDVAQRSAEDRRTALGAAASRNDPDLANHEFTILTVLRQRVEQLGAESNQCVGEELTLIGESKVTTTIDPNLPTDDSSAYPEYPVVSLPPTCASCVK